MALNSVIDWNVRQLQQHSAAHNFTHAVCENYFVYCFSSDVCKTLELQVVSSRSMKKVYKMYQYHWIFFYIWSIISLLNEWMNVDQWKRNSINAKRLNYNLLMSRVSQRMILENWSLFSSSNWTFNQIIFQFFDVDNKTSKLLPRVRLKRIRKSSMKRISIALSFDQKKILVCLVFYSRETNDVKFSQKRLLSLAFVRKQQSSRKIFFHRHVVFRDALKLYYASKLRCVFILNSINILYIM